MKFELEHHAISKCLAWEKLLERCSTLDIFCRRIDKLARKLAHLPPSTKNDIFHLSGIDGANKFKGDIFEIFCEFLIKLSPLDDRIGIFDYHPLPENEPDTGVDGSGRARDGSCITVQIKYRIWDYTLHHISEHLNNFRLTSYQKFGINPNDTGKMLILTTGKEIHWKTLDKQFGRAVRCISRNASYRCLKGTQSHTVDSLFSLKTLVDGHIGFWDTFRKGVEL